MNEFSITSTITFTDYRKLVFKLHYSSFYNKALICIAMVYLAGWIGYLLFHVHQLTDKALYESAFSTGFTQFCGVFLACILISPGIMLLQIGRSFKHSRLLVEKTITTLGTEGLRRKGETFANSYTWHKVAKVNSIGNFIVIYHGKRPSTFVKYTEDDISNIKRLRNYLQLNYPKMRFNF